MGPDKNVRGHVQIVHGDDYFNVTLDDPTSYVDCPNLEGPGAIDWIALLWVVRVVEDVAMTTTVVAATTEDRRGDSIITTQQQPTVIVEGFLLLANPSLLARLDLILFLEADETSCLQRRLHRNPNRSAAQAEGLRKYLPIPTDRRETAVVEIYATSGFYHMFQNDFQENVIVEESEMLGLTHVVYLF